MDNMKYLLLLAFAISVSCRRVFDVDEDQQHRSFLEVTSEATASIGPESVDWRQKGAVTPVKNQRGEKCKFSSWAFAATGVLEGQHFLKSGKLVSLSEQNLIDCSQMYHNKGCHGGYTFAALHYIMGNGGIDTETSYPYEAKEATSCRYNSSKPSDSGVTVKDVDQKSLSGNEDELKKAVATIGPIAVSMDASLRSFQEYKDGVYYDPQCSSTRRLKHEVLVVGYGTSNESEDYWIVKNSWGTEWGEKGYFWMARNKRNQCGLATSDIFIPIL